MQDEGAGEVAPLGQQGGVRFAAAVGAVVVAVAVCDGHGRLVSLREQAANMISVEKQGAAIAVIEEIDRSPSFPRLRQASFSRACHDLSTGRSVLHIDSLSVQFTSELTDTSTYRATQKGGFTSRRLHAVNAPE